MRWLFLLALLFATPAWSQALVVPTCGGLNLTAGTPHNVTVDINGQSCRVGGGGGGSVVGSTWSASDALVNGWTLSNGGLTVTPTAAAAWATTRVNSSKSTGKYYIEYASIIAPTSSAVDGFGLTTGAIENFYLGAIENTGGMYLQGATLVGSGFVATQTTPAYQPLLNDVVQVAIDIDAGKVWIGVNNTWYMTGSPATGANPMMSIVAPVLGQALFPAISLNSLAASGSWTLQATAASQKYAPPAGFSAWDGTGATSCSQATAYLARATGEVTHAADLTTLICGLVTDGVWTKLDALYVLAQQTQADAQLNLVGTSYGLTQVGLLRPAPKTPAFTSYVGFNFPTGYFTTSFNAAIAPSPQFIQNSASFGDWVYDSTVFDGSGSMGTDNHGSTGESNLYVNYSGGLLYIRVNNGTTGAIPIVGTKGLYVGDRSSSANVIPYVNGVAQAAQAGAAVSPLSSPFLIGAAGGVETSQTLCAAFIGASLGSAGQLALYNRLRTYMTAVGVP